jgi:hypothetical protein
MEKYRVDKKFTQDEIDKLVAQYVAFHPVDENDIEVDPIPEDEQVASLHPNDEGGVWVRAWVYVRLGEVFGPACGHSACRQNWIDTSESECVEGGG